MTRPKALAVVGPTGSGKSSLAVQLAQTFDGELICADSRQLYKGLSIGSAKDAGAWQTVDGTPRYILTSGIWEHVVDVLDPNQESSVDAYQTMAFAAMDDILSRQKIPILVGGTGLYVQAIIENLQFPNVAPNPELRQRLEVKSLDELMETYRACDPVGAMSIDENNRRRLIRAIEVCWTARRPFSELQTKGPKRYDTLQLAFDLAKETLNARLDARVIDMLKQGLVEEVRALLDAGIDPRKSALSGIGYREVVQYLLGQTGLDEMVADIQRNTRQLARRQLSWFKRDPAIHWIKTPQEGVDLAHKFLEK